MRVIRKDTELYKKMLREQREQICFSVINRGKLWYNCLTAEQLAELKRWYHDWLNVTETLQIPVKPEWLDTLKITEGEEII